MIVGILISFSRTSISACLPLFNIHIFRPLNSRYNEGGIHRRSYNLYDRGNKTSRGITHRTSRSTINQKQTSPQKTDEEL
jgi:hypothetical protein